MAELDIPPGAVTEMDNTGLDQDPETEMKSPPETNAQDEEIKQQADEARDQQFVGFNKAGKDLGDKADLNLATLYGDARLVRKLDDYDLDKDPKDLRLEEFSGMPVDAPLFGLCAPLSELAELGPGIPLYYYFVKYVLIVLAFGFFVAGIACWDSNTRAGDADDWGDDASDNFVIRMSIGAHGDDGTIPAWQAVLHMVVGIFILISYYFLRNKLIKVDGEIDKDEVTASDYTIWVKGLGQNFTADEVKEFFIKNGLPTDQDLDVKRVNIPYEISDYVDWIREHNTLKEKLQYMDVYMKEHEDNLPTEQVLLCCKKSYPAKEELEKEIADVYAKIQKWQEDREVGVGEDLLIGQVFITCNKQIDVRTMHDYWGGDWVKRMWDYILNKLAVVCPCCRRERSKLDFKGNALEIQIAPEPNDIFYENLGLSVGKRLKNRLLTWLRVFLALGVCFGIIYGASTYQTVTYNDYRDKDEDDRTSEDLTNVRAASIIPAGCVLFINIALAKIIRQFTSIERLQTITEYNSQVALRLTLAQTINTAVIVIAVNYDFEENWFVPGGLADDIFSIMLATAFLQPLLYFGDPWYIVRKCRRRAAEKAEYITQEKANALFEGPPLDMAKRYSNIMKSFILALMYAPILPAGFLISFFGVLFEYWIDKYLLLRRHSRPSRMSSDLSDTITKLIPWCIFLYAMMLFIFNSVLDSDGAPLAFIWMWITFSHLFLPINTCRRLCEKSQLGWYVSQKEYEQEALRFYDDYDRANPVTEMEGWQNYNDLLEKAESEQPKEAISPLKGVVQAMIHPKLPEEIQLKHMQTPGNIQNIGKTMLQQNIASYATSRSTMQQTYYRLNQGARQISQRRTSVVPTQGSYAVQQQQARMMIMNQRNQQTGQQWYQMSSHYGMSRAGNPWLYNNPVQQPMAAMAQHYVTPHHAYQAPRVQNYQVHPQVQPAPPVYQAPVQAPQPIHHPQQAYPAQPQAAYPQQAPAQPQYATPVQPVQYPQQAGYQPTAPPQGVVHQPITGFVQQPGVQPNYQSSFQQAPAAYPPPQYGNQPPNHPSNY